LEQNLVVSVCDGLYARRKEGALRNGEQRKANDNCDSDQQDRRRLRSWFDLILWIFSRR
jgi:hypothetical protein